MKKDWKIQIPNMLSALRLLMVPVFVYFYFNFAEGRDTLIAAGIYALAWVTDALDGYLARKNGWITDVGKILDPLADKLMQITAAACFTVDSLIFLTVLIPLLIKECALAIGAMTIMKRKKVVVQASWYGKLATVVLFGLAFLRIVIRDCPALDIAVCALTVTMLVFALTMYYFKDFRGKYDLKLFSKK